jgi:GxxExxY protein
MLFYTSPKIKYLREFNIPPSFNGEKKNRNRPDFIIENKIIIEFKTKTIITKEDYFQMQRYLTTSKKKLGLITNFRQKYIKPKRIINPEINNAF